MSRMANIIQKEILKFDSINNDKFCHLKKKYSNFYRDFVALGFDVTTYKDKH